jgi:hypothetical protein
MVKEQLEKTAFFAEPTEKLQRKRELTDFHRTDATPCPSVVASHGLQLVDFPGR